MTYHTPRTRSDRSMASAIANIGRQRPHQEVRVLTTMYGMPFGPKRLVAVGGQYFEVFDLTYRQLLMGVRPDELELDECDPDEESD